MILNGFTTPSGCVSANSKAYKPQQSGSIFASIPCLPDHSALLGTKSSWETHRWFRSRSSGGISVLHLSAASTPLLSGDQGSLSHTIPSLPQRHRFRLSPQASKEASTGFRFPPMTKKPRWWWRTLACLPYLMPLHETWMYAETAYHLHPFLEDFEFLTYPFLEILGKFPIWFLMAYFFVAYLGVVRRKEWPHFFRFHVVVGMLLEILLQVVGTVSRWLPNGLYWGMYADIPFISDAAYIQIPYE
ncbi:Protein TIC 20-I, chloroplastic-like protein [Melia azedarach]|uniref:Protein TIC 20-I, chloroplastic-like protein n=1 Tax=Melia azedarach TaxID=155640 RepID=A0ACC1WSY2_MELAZ|nr:Protein TIC 20-I, chloroplastic-like protein [Melia azedarach]